MGCSNWDICKSHLHVSLNFLHTCFLLRRKTAFLKGLHNKGIVNLYDNNSKGSEAMTRGMKQLALLPLRALGLVDVGVMMATFHCPYKIVIAR